MNYIDVISLVNIKFDFLSIIFLVIIIVGIFVGLFKGFLGLLVSFLSIFGSVAFTLFLTSILIDPLITAEMFNGIEESIFNSLLEKNELFNSLVTPENKDIVIAEALKLINVPSFISNLLSGIFINNIPTDGIILGHLVSESITKVIASIILFIIIFIISFIVFFILRKVAKKFNEIAIIGTINRITGAIGGLILGFCICVCVSIVINILMGFSTGINDYFVALLNLDNEEVWSIAKAIINLTQIK